jgi:photosystem II stability/assembly factor-like uncharacterized protein
MTRTFLGLAAAGVALATPVSPAWAQVEMDSNTLGGLQARVVGTAATSGRIAAIDAVPTRPLTVYVGAAGGGLWKSTDGAVSFKPIFEENLQSIGAIAVDPKNPTTVWVGTGESWTRNSVSIGDGLYKSTDGGDSWQRVGLENSERIARIQVHPSDGKTVWVCATGHLWGSHEERGVYKTTDAGKTWKRTLFVDPDTGCADLALDPQDPTILYAGMWQFRRKPWAFSSGGKGSGLYKSSDGGETWRELTAGFPAGNKGRIAVAVAPSRPSVLYALVESRNTALYRSDNTGETWTEVNSSFNVQARPFYFARVMVDPSDFNHVYKPGLSLTMSVDGGKSFSSALSLQNGFGNVHSDMHALWINPKDPAEMLLGTDGGVYLSHDAGRGWRFLKSLPVSQFYHVSYDMRWPYWVYGGLQDNGSWGAPSRGLSGAINNADWLNVGGGDGFWAFVDATDPDIVYSESQGGEATRRHMSTGETKSIKPLPEAGDPDYRFNWNTPIHLSPTQPGTLYMGGQFLFRSRDRGDNWEKISPDLTTNDSKKQAQKQSGGLTVDNSSAETHTTIYTISESPKNKDVIWAGTDDGNLQVTRDGGAHWTNVVKNVPGLPAATWVSTVETGRFEEGTAFVTFDNHHNDDMKTYVFKTTDFGQTWKPLATDAISGYAHVVRQDLANPDLLFVGTELGLYVSLDGGAKWVRFTGNLPKVAVRDVAIHPRDLDLLIATHGRGIYIVDDLTPLRNLSRQVLETDAAILPSRPAVAEIASQVQSFAGTDEFSAANPDSGAVITYYLKKRHLVGDIRVEVADDKGGLVASLPAGKRRGLNRVNWSLRMPPPKMPGGNSIITDGGAFFGPRVLPGTYTVKLIEAGKTYTGKVEVVPDPRSKHSAEDRALQHDTAQVLYAMLGRLTYTVDGVEQLRDGAKKRAEGLKAGDKLKGSLQALADKLEKFRSILVATGEGGWLSGDEQLREKLGKLYGGVNSFDGRPSRSQLDQVKVMEERLKKAEGQLAADLQGDVAAINRELTARKLEILKVKTKEEWEKDAGKPPGAMTAEGEVEGPVAFLLPQLPIL